MFARIPGKGITLEMYIRNTQVNKKIYIKKKKKRLGYSILMGHKYPILPLHSSDSPKTGGRIVRSRVDWKQGSSVFRTKRNSCTYGPRHCVSMYKIIAS